MKKTLAILFMLLPLLLDAQEKAAYRITYDCDALYNRTRGVYRWNLDIGNTTAVFYSPNWRGHSEAAKSLQGTDDIASAMDVVKQLGSRYPNRNSLEILIGAPEHGKYTYVNKVGVDQLMYEESLPDMDWELTDSVKMVCGYECHQARAEVYGRTWTVWYSTEIPIPYGPYLLGGLPGLILEAVDSDGIFRFTSVGIEDVHDGTDVNLYGKTDAVRCTRKKYLALRKSNAGQTYSEAVENLLGKGSVARIVDASGKDISNQVQSEKNYLDLK